LAQPSLLPINYSHEITINQEKNILRYTSFVEIMMPCFSRTALGKCIETFTENQSGWGLDLLWYKILGYPKNKIAIIDDVVAYHSKKSDIKNGDFYKKLGKSPFDELNEIKSKYKVDFDLSHYGVVLK